MPQQGCLRDQILQIALSTIKIDRSNPLEQCENVFRIPDYAGMHAHNGCEPLAYDC